MGQRLVSWADIAILRLAWRLTFDSCDPSNFRKREGAGYRSLVILVAIHYWRESVSTRQYVLVRLTGALG